MAIRARRPAGLVALLMALALLVAACAPQDTGGEGGGDGDGAAQQPVRGGTVVFGAEQEPAGSLNVDLACCTLFWGAMIENQVLEGAYEVQPDFTYEPNLIEGEAEIEEGPPFKVTYNIKQEAVWSDGTPVTAQDFKFTLDTHLDPKVDIDSTDGYDLITDTEIVDDKTITFTFDKAFAPYRDLFDRVFPKHAIEGENFNKVWTNCICDRNGDPIASGPFIITNYQKGSQLTMERNDEYWGEHTAYLDKVVWRFITDTNSEIQALRGGEVDLIYPQPQLELSQLEGVEGVEIISNFGATWEHVDFQQKNPLLGEFWVRQALAHGIDRDAIVERLLQKINPEAEVLQNIIYVANQEEYEPHYQIYDYDPERSRQLLEDNGCQMAGDVYECNGEPMSFGFKSTAGNKLRELTFEVIQQQLQKIGVEVKSEFGEADVVFADLAEEDYDIFMFAWVGTADPFSSNSIWECGGDQNFQNSCEPRATKLIKQTVSMLDPQERADTYNRADQLMAENELPVLPLYQKPTYLAFYDYIHNMTDNTTNEGPFYDSEDWWIEKGQQ